MLFHGINDRELLKAEKQKLELGLRTYNRSFLYFNIFNEKNGHLVGWCGYHTWYLEHNRAELGYSWFNEESKNKGHMSRLLDWVLRYGFDEMKLNRIEALTASYNAPSKALLKKFNFEQEGILKGHYLFNSKFEESEIFALLRDQFDSMSLVD